MGLGFGDCRKDEIILFLLVWAILGYFIYPWFFRC